MANKAKVGLEYFPFEVSFFSDIKVRKLIKYQGCKAIPIYTLLLCKIYDNGYYMRWDNELPFMISETTGYEEGYVNEVIKCCAAVGLINEFLFREKKVLTSKGIQERFNSICKSAKRKTEIIEFNLISSEYIDNNLEELVKNTEELPIDSEEKTQRKGKESIVKERKGKERKADHLFIDSEFYDFELFEKQFENTEYQYCDLKIYYEKVKNWSASRGAKRIDWIATARNFMLSDKQENKLIKKNGTTTNNSSLARAISNVHNTNFGKL